VADSGARSDSPLVALQKRAEKLQTEKDLLEEQVRQLHRVKTSTDLLAGVAHDLATALTGIMWCSEALVRRLETSDPELHAGIVDFVGATRYARELARRLTSIGREPETSFAPCRAVSVVFGAIEVLETLRPRSASLGTVLHVADASVWGNADQLQQVLVNLVSNAFDAIAQTGGKVQVELERCASSVEGEEGQWLCFRVSDTGHGMDEATLARAFDAFFTTKGARDGNGLGLVVARTIVQRHGGLIRARSKVGEGTSIEVLLPELVE
jgi:two-component system, cell cycle sensor histidine kinase and response regulator CckA